MMPKYQIGDILFHHYMDKEDYYLVEDITLDGEYTKYSMRDLLCNVVCDHNIFTVDNLDSVQKVA